MRFGSKSIFGWGIFMALIVALPAAAQEKNAEKGKTEKAKAEKVAGDTGTMREIGKRDQKKSRRPGGRSAVLGRARLSGRGLEAGHVTYRLNADLPGRFQHQAPHAEFRQGPIGSVP